MRKNKKKAVSEIGQKSHRILFHNERPYDEEFAIQGIHSSLE